MNPASQHLEGKLLDYAYGELSEGEAKTVEAHLRACPQCADSLTAMKQVRRMMSQLPIAAAPQAGLESLLTYAQKAAETARARPARRRRWLLWVAPIGTAAALSLVLTISSKVMRRPEATLAFKQDETRGDWEGLPRLAAKKDADAPAAAEKRLAEKAEAPASEAEARAKEAAPASKAPGQWASPPKDRKGSRLPAAPEAAAPPPERRGQPVVLSLKAKAAAPKPELAQGAVAGASDSTEGDNAREEAIPGGVVGGVVGGVLGGAPPVASADSSKVRQPPEVASQRAASLEAKQTPSASHERSSTPGSAAEPPSDRERELAQLQQALAAGAQGQERARLLRRLCEVLDALGRTRDADTACDTVVREFPTSEEAKSALQRLKVRAAQPRR